jgi:hypothetical protein
MSDLDDLAAAAGNPPLVPARRVTRMWTVHDRGTQYGPHSEDDLIAMLSNGSLTQEALIWAEESQQWLSLTSFLPERSSVAMNLVACPACASAVSAAASSCPRCGHPFRQSGVRSGRLKPQHTGRVVAIERTGKDLKFQQLVATFLLIASIVTVAIAAQQERRDILVVGTAMFCLAVPWLLLVRIFIWWRHG